MITLTDSDDPQFIAITNRLLPAALSQCTTSEIYLVQIDGWFDAKWLNFSGKILGAFGHWHKSITVPPFHPNRVLREHHFSLNKQRSIYEATETAPLHRKRSSEANISHLIAKISSSGIFFWYSTTPSKADRASIMLYRSQDGEIFSWYASFHKSPSWKQDRCHGITATELNHLLSAAEPA